MAVEKTVWWVCTKCGKRAAGSTKPGATTQGKCSGSSAGTHTWVKA